VAHQPLRDVADIIYEFNTRPSSPIFVAVPRPATIPPDEVRINISFALFNTPTAALNPLSTSLSIVLNLLYSFNDVSAWRTISVNTEE
jgi:hypothetical protein